MKKESLPGSNFIVLAYNMLLFNLLDTIYSMDVPHNLSKLLVMFLTLI